MSRFNIKEFLLLHIAAHKACNPLATYNGVTAANTLQEIVAAIKVQPGVRTEDKSGNNNGETTMFTCGGRTNDFSWDLVTTISTQIGCGLAIETHRVAGRPYESPETLGLTYGNDKGTIIANGRHCQQQLDVITAIAQQAAALTLFDAVEETEYLASVHFVYTGT